MRELCLVDVDEVAEGQSRENNKTALRVNKTKVSLPLSSSNADKTGSEKASQFKIAMIEGAEVSIMKEIVVSRTSPLNPTK